MIPTWLISRSLASAAKLRGECRQPLMDICFALQALDVLFPSLDTRPRSANRPLQSEARFDHSPWIEWNSINTDGDLPIVSAF